MLVVGAKYTYVGCVSVLTWGYFGLLLPHWVAHFTSILCAFLLSAWTVKSVLLDAEGVVIMLWRFSFQVRFRIKGLGFGV
jgi:hypothetical protein